MAHDEMELKGLLSNPQFPSRRTKSLYRSLLSMIWSRSSSGSMLMQPPRVAWSKRLANSSSQLARGSGIPVIELHEHLFRNCYLPSLSPMVESKRSAPARRAKGVRMKALRAKTPLAVWFTTADRQGTPQKAARPSGLPRLRSCSRFCHQRVFRPKMLRISTFKILLHLRIGATPKIG